MSGSVPGQEHGYVLGQSSEEHARLDRQGAVLRDITWRFLRDSGVGPGMRVLDVGCGTGDVSLVAAELVGPAGEVIGVDRAPGVLETARSRAQAHGAAHVRFVERDVMQLDLDVVDGRPVDAAIGRLLLVHLREPAAMLRSLPPLLADQALVGFQDLVIFDPLPKVERPLLRRSIHFIQQAFVAAGTSYEMGLRLPALYREAGLPTPQLRIDGVPVDGADRARLVWLAETVRSLLPVLEKIGIAKAAEVDIDTLGARMTEEAERVPATTWGMSLASAAARVPRRV